MDITIIALVLVAPLVLVIALLIYLLLKQKKNNFQDKYEQRLEHLERGLYDSLRDVRDQQQNFASMQRVESQAMTDHLSEQIDKRVERLADVTDKHLEKIRMTVDERLNTSLEQKFSEVSKRLAEVHTGLGEVKSLTNGVDDLKRVLTNVKTRGIWGEMQLGNLLKDMLSESRYATNVEVVPHSSQRVEFALRLPGPEDEEVMLPIDAKFPQEDYQRLQDAREAGDAEGQTQALKQLERRLKSEADDISAKYICPPYSTDFAIMYLPSEGLFAEAISIPGLADELQRKYRVSLAGPSTFAALINSLQLGFRTLAVQKRTDEVWTLLALVRQDMASLGASLDKTAKKLEEAQNNIQAANKHINKINKRLTSMETMDEIEG
ncbi:MAG: DNA recombination protein RmuC [Phascolarctobacterium sp.]|nr:DNA recombination protein RmuC [Phascolarctobacterium sp.]